MCIRVSRSKCFDENFGSHLLTSFVDLLPSQCHSSEICLRQQTSNHILRHPERSSDFFRTELERDIGSFRVKLDLPEADEVSVGWHCPLLNIRPPDALKRHKGFDLDRLAPKSWAVNHIDIDAAFLEELTNGAECKPLSRIYMSPWKHKCIGKGAQHLAPTRQ